MSVEGQDERPTVEWVATNLEATASKLSLPHGPEFLERAVDDLLARAVDVRALGAALVGSEARERELVEIAAKERGHAARHLDRALKAEARERVEVAHAHERGYRRGRVEAKAREAVLVEALKLALIEIEPEGGTDPWRDTVIRRARSALAGVVEAEPEDPLPAELRKVLEDPGIVIRQDAAVFELIGRWQKAKAATESAEPYGSERA